jgi:PAS domain S-box-containing protein
MEQAPLVPGRGQNELFRLLVESVKDYAIFVLGPTGLVVSWNEGAQRIKGYRAGEIIGKHFSIFYPPRDVQQGKPDYALRVAADEGRWQEEGWRVRKDGSRFWASVVITALVDTTGDLIGFAKVTRDLTERKRAEEERIQLLDLEHAARVQAETAVERLKVMQSVTEAALAHLDLDSLLTALLDRIAETLSVDTVAILLLDEEEDALVARAAKGIEEEVEQAVRIPVGKGFAGCIAAQRQAVVLDDIDHADVLNPLLLQKGIKSLLGVPLLVEGRVLGVLHVGSLHRRQFTEEDVQLLQIVGDRAALAIGHARLFEAARTARHDAAVAEATVKARDEFLAVAAHELKTPLTSLRLAGQMLLRRMEQGEAPDMVALERSLRLVDRQIDRLAHLVTHLLETVRLQTGTMELDRKHTDLGELVRDVAEQVQTQTSLHQLVVRAPEQVCVPVDALRFEQVVLNLLDNAVKFSPEGGQIDVDLEQLPEGGTRLAVRDRGLGVSPEHRAHLFERFYQAHGREHRSGMGLGLYITREIVERHGGSIRAEFPPDGGTRFVVELPAASNASGVSGRKHAGRASQ